MRAPLLPGKDTDDADMPSDAAARRIEVNGVVQGVGFRPFVYSLADRHGLKGEVANTSAGVVIHVEGPPPKLDAFEADLLRESPPLAHIVEVSAQEVPARACPDFRIVTSRADAARSTLISPDVSVCADCLEELFDPDDRRFRYPFINCTNCGPRYTIIDDVPYDRSKTSMRHFRMCPRCQEEYDDPADRRFHAQPNACPDCGPHVWLSDNRRRRLEAENPVDAAARLLKEGAILAVKGLGGYHLAVDAENEEAVVRLRKRKLREEKPFALMAADLEAVGRFARVEGAEAALLQTIQRPIVLLRQKTPNAIAAAVAPRNRYFGVMLPYTPVHYLLLHHPFSALVMTSGNLSDEPIAVDNEDAFDRLAAIADYFLVHNRDIYLRSDDSILRHVAGEPRFVRRSRGYVPIPIFLKRKLPAVLACGAELKNTVCLTKGDRAFLSQHIGDLENLRTYDFFQLTIAHLQRILDISPAVVAHDMHPDYLSTRHALEQSRLPAVSVQHHHAHIVSCMAEHKLEGAVIGLAFDGTGYGTDGRIWGGEVLIAEAERFERAAHIDYVPMPGGAAAIKAPWRMAAAYLRAAFGTGFIDLGLPALEAIGTEKLETISAMIAGQINSPLTSSLGRLFDGVAAILGVRDQVNFEGQAAMELEMMSAEPGAERYDFDWETADALRILPEPVVRGVVRDLREGVPAAAIGARFHATLIALFAELCTVIGKGSGLKRVVLSGGCFQNATLLTGLQRALAEKKFEVYAHRLVPANDGGISLGQAVICACSV